MKTVTNWVVVAFDASGYPMQAEWVHTDRAEANRVAQEWRKAGNDWVKVVTVTSPPVPHGN